MAMGSLARAGITSRKRWLISALSVRMRQVIKVIDYTFEMSRLKSDTKIGCAHTGRYVRRGDLSTGVFWRLNTVLMNGLVEVINRDIISKMDSLTETKGELK